LRPSVVQNSLEAEPEPELDTSGSGVSRVSDQMHREMVTQCYRLLETIIHTVYDEYRAGSRSHWGAEDRRTKLWFIVMGQNTIKGFFAALLSGTSPVLVHALLAHLEHGPDGSP
jgi:hypothetical protein